MEQEVTGNKDKGQEATAMDKAWGNNGQAWDGGNKQWKPETNRRDVFEVDCLQRINEKDQSRITLKSVS